MCGFTYIFNFVFVVVEIMKSLHVLFLQTHIKNSIKLGNGNYSVCKLFVCIWQKKDFLFYLFILLNKFFFSDVAKNALKQRANLVAASQDLVERASQDYPANYQDLLQARVLADQQSSKAMNSREITISFKFNVSDITCMIFYILQYFQHNKW